MFLISSFYLNSKKLNYGHVYKRKGIATLWTRKTIASILSKIYTCDHVIIYLYINYDCDNYTNTFFKV